MSIKGDLGDAIHGLEYKYRWNTTMFSFFCQNLKAATFSAVDGGTTPISSTTSPTSASANSIGAVKSSARLAPTEPKNTPANN